MEVDPTEAEEIFYGRQDCVTAAPLDCGALLDVDEYGLPVADLSARRKDTQQTHLNHSTEASIQ